MMRLDIEALKELLHSLASGLVTRSENELARLHTLIEDIFKEVEDFLGEDESAKLPETPTENGHDNDPGDNPQNQATPQA